MNTLLAVIYFAMNQALICAGFDFGNNYYRPGSGIVLNGNIFSINPTNIASTNIYLYNHQWVDLLLNYGYSVLGPNAPQLTATTSNSSIALLAFDNSDILYAQTQFPHNIAATNSQLPNFYIVPHVHFDVDKYIDATHTNVTWQIVWQWASIDRSFIELQGTNAITTGITQGATHYIANFTPITNNTPGISSIFRCKISRPASTGQDYSNNHDVYLDQLDLHVPVGNFTLIGSRGVTTQ